MSVIKAGENVKKQKGNLTIEASLVLTLFTFFILFFFSFGRVYKAQNIVSHATIQCAESLSVESYFRETFAGTKTGTVIKWVSQLTGDNAVTDSMLSLSEVDLGSVIKNNFAVSVADDQTKADKILKANGIKDGLNGISFGNSKVDGNDIIINTTYTVELQFPLFGKKEFTMTKAAKSRAFKEISYSVTVSSNNPAYGDVSNSVRAEHGDKVTITAQPKPGYEFVKWDDGSTDPVRDIVVSGNSNHVAIFKPITYGVTVLSSNPLYGTGNGSCSADYGTNITISATANTGYHFVKWSDGDTNPSRTVTVSGKMTFTAVFEPNKYKITANPEKDAYGYTEGSCEADYNTTVIIKAFAKTGYMFQKWSDGNTSPTRSVTVKGDATYTAKYIKSYKVTFNANGGTTNTSYMWVASGGTLNSLPVASRSCYTFQGWFTKASGGSKISATQAINSDITVYAQWKESAHSFKEVSRTGNNCTGGKITSKCSYCGKTTTTNYSGHGHSWYETKRSGTVCTGGTIYYSCRNCSATKTGTYEPQHNFSGRCNKKHSLSGTWIGSCGTHTANGYYCVTCTRCGKQQGYPYWCGVHAGGRRPINYIH